MEPAVGDTATPSGEDEDLEGRAQQRRRELWERHAGLPSTDLDLDDEDAVEEVLALTEDVLELEDAAAEHLEAAATARSSRIIYTAAAVLGLGSTALLVTGVVVGWYSGWGAGLLAWNIVVALGVVAVHGNVPPAGHYERAWHALAALGLGVVLCVLATGWLPWWVTLIAVLLTLANGLAFLAAGGVIEPAQRA